MTDRATPLTGVYTGRTDILKEEGHRSAIVKSLVRKRLRLDSGGLEGDEQADLSAHGGAYRALHYYPSEHYAFWLAAFPRHAEKFAPGTFGENVSAPWRVSRRKTSRSAMRSASTRQFWRSAFPAIPAGNSITVSRSRPFPDKSRTNDARDGFSGCWGQTPCNWAMRAPAFSPHHRA